MSEFKACTILVGAETVVTIGSKTGVTHRAAPVDDRRLGQHFLNAPAQLVRVGDCEGPPARLSVQRVLAFPILRSDDELSDQIVRVAAVQ